ncbi:benzoate membrane transport protein [Rhodococcus rhodochrous J45]|uniref:Benzoate membrane transport protein n=1 Tax=Rhodococcus rhodochrous J45 TaxID=935266 RepID=A0A562DL66_RHORH|nr:benzoate membrane transport protein [Rhodococcus rhodochrous J45]
MSKNRGQGPAFVTAFATTFTFGSLVTFVVTIADLSLFNIHAAFWGILIGYLVSRVLERGQYAGQRR